MNMRHEPVAVAVSGGADSLYSLIDLRERGYEVFGLHGIFLTPETRAEADAANAMRQRLADACARIGVSLHVADLREAFTRLVIRPFVEAYAAGLTPNPCAHCNAAVKFGLLQDEALHLGAERLATGHYATLFFGNDEDSGQAGVPSARPASGRGAAVSGDFPGRFPVLCQGGDASKDQSYFLGLVPLARLARAMFPLAVAHKKDVLAALDRLGIIPPQPGESQEVCFVPGDEYRDFVPRMAKRFGIALPGPGPMLLVDGAHQDTHRGTRTDAYPDMRPYTCLGTHQGLWRYTEGQRRGLGVAWREPLYVLGKELEGRALRLGPKAALHAAGCECDAVNYLLAYNSWPGTVLVKTRYRERPKEAVAERLEGGGLRIRFAAPDSAVAAGQIAAVYVSGPGGRLRLVAGGVIARGL